MTEELKPCPFCGGDANVIQFSSNEFVQCKSCKAASDDTNGIRKWDTRAQPKYKRVDLEVMKEPPTAVRIAEYTQGYGDGFNRAIDYIKSKYGDLYVEVK